MATLAASTVGQCPAWIGDPYAVGMSCVSKMSLTPIGIPCSRPRRASLDPVELAGARKHRFGIHVDPRPHPRVVRVDPVEERLCHEVDGSASVVERPGELGDGIACPGW